MEQQTGTPRGAFFDLSDLLAAHAREGKLSHRFINYQSLRMGLYKLSAGSEDPQTPHEDDEIYYILEGRAKILVDDKAQPIQTGSVVFVATAVPHKFVDIEEDLTVLVFYSHYKPTL